MISFVEQWSIWALDTSVIRYLTLGESASQQNDLHKKKNSPWHREVLRNSVTTHPHARLRIFHPHRSCTALGYMVDSLEVFVTPQKNSPPAKRQQEIRHLPVQKHTSHIIYMLLWLDVTFGILYSFILYLLKLTSLCTWINKIQSDTQMRIFLYNQGWVPKLVLLMILIVSVLLSLVLFQILVYCRY